MSYLDKWLPQKWWRSGDEREIRRRDEQYVASLARIFSGSDGQFVINYWLDTIYCQVADIETNARFLEGRRSVIHDFLTALDAAEHPEKRINDVKVETK